MEPCCRPWDLFYFWFRNRLNIKIISPSKRTCISNITSIHRIHSVSPVIHLTVPALINGAPAQPPCGPHPIYSTQPLASVNYQQQREDKGCFLFVFFQIKLLVFAANSSSTRTGTAWCLYCWSPGVLLRYDCRCICWPRPERWLQPHYSSSVMAERLSAQVKHFTLHWTEHVSQFTVIIVSVYPFLSFKVRWLYKNLKAAP